MRDVIVGIIAARAGISTGLGTDRKGGSVRTRVRLSVYVRPSAVSPCLSRTHARPPAVVRYDLRPSEQAITYIVSSIPFRIVLNLSTVRIEPAATPCRRMVSFKDLNVSNTSGTEIALKTPFGQRTCEPAR